MAEENQTETLKDIIIKASAIVPAEMIELPDGRTFVTRRNDFALDQITAPNAAEVLMPKRVTTTLELQTTDSLIEYINRFKNEDTVTFASIAGNQIISVIDYHGEPTANTPQPLPSENQGVAASAAAKSSTPDPRLLSHRAMLNLPFAEEWTIWNGQNGRVMGQIAFADFLEQNMSEIVEPDGAALLELCRDLHVLSKSEFKTSVRMGGYNRISMDKIAEVSGSKEGGIELPTKITLRLPVYFGGNDVTMEAFFYAQNDDGHLKLSYKLIRPETVRQKEFKAVVTDVHTLTDVTTIYGIAPKS